MNENNQYGQALTKPLPTVCIKKKKTIPTWCESNLLINKASIED